MKRLLLMASLFWCVTSVAHNGKKHDGKIVAPPTSIEKVREEYIERVRPIFQKKCFDCHSNQTSFPWYYKLPLIRGMIDSDIKEAKEHLDMSNGYPFSGHGNIVDDLEEIKEAVVKNEMPPLSYKIMHWGSQLSRDERDKIIEWVNMSSPT